MKRFKTVFVSWETTLCGMAAGAGYLGDKLQRHVVMPDWFSSACSVLFVGGLIVGFFLARSEGGHRRGRD